jgi:hypothetical protein
MKIILYVTAFITDVIFFITHEIEIISCVMEFITYEMKLKNEAFEFISYVMKTVSFVMSSVTNEIFSIAYVVFFTFRAKTGIVGMVAIIFSLSLSPFTTG